MLAQTARKALVATLVAGAVVVLALALWKLRLVISLVFLGFIIAAAMRPGIDALQRWRIPRGVGVALHYLVLVGSFAGIVEIVPVVGPLAAGALAVGVGFTVSWHTALAAGLVVLAVRLLEDYIVLPKVLGDATGLSPLVVLFSVSAITILFGGFAVLFAVPLAAVLATLVDVLLRGRDPAEEEVPTVLFPAKDAEG